MLLFLCPSEDPYVDALNSPVIDEFDIVDLRW